MTIDHVKWITIQDAPGMNVSSSTHVLNTPTGCIVRTAVISGPELSETSTFVPGVFWCEVINAFDAL